MTTGLTRNPLDSAMPADRARQRQPSAAAWARPGVRAAVALAVVLIAALALRLWGLSFGLPYLHHPDEPRKVAIATRMVRTGDLNPHYFKKPTLQIYLNAAAQGGYYLLGRATGWFQSLDDLREPLRLGVGVGRADLPELFLIGRGITLAFGVGGVALLFLLGRAWTGRAWVGLLAAAMLAVSPGHVAASRCIHQDAQVVFFLLLAGWASLRVLRRGAWRDYLLAGVAAGLAVGSKYNAAVALILPVAAHWLQPDHRQKPDLRLCGTLAAAAAVFLATSPFALLDATTFVAELVFEAIHCIVGHPGMGDSTPVWYGRYLFTVEGLTPWLGAAVLLSFAAAPAVRRFRRPAEPIDRDSLLIAAFPLIYLAVILPIRLHNEQTLLPALPFLFLFAARWLVERGWLRRRAVIAAVMFALLFAPPLARNVEATLRLTRPDSRETARAWIDANLPAGSRVVIEGYTPFVDPARFDVSSVWLLCKQTPAWYVGQGVDYLVFAEKSFGRFYDTPARHPREVAGYEALFAAFVPVRVFDDGGYEVRVYAVAPGQRPPRNFSR